MRTTLTPCGAYNDCAEFYRHFEWIPGHWYVVVGRGKFEAVFLAVVDDFGTLVPVERVS